MGYPIEKNGGNFLAEDDPPSSRTKGDVEVTSAEGSCRTATKWDPRGHEIAKLGFT